MVIAASNAQLNKQIEEVRKAFTDLSWHQILQQCLNKLLLIILTILLFALILWVGRLVITQV